MLLGTAASPLPDPSNSNDVAGSMPTAMECENDNVHDPDHENHAHFDLTSSDSSDEEDDLIGMPPKQVQQTSPKTAGSPY